MTTLGATGEYPDGKLNDTDEGELCLAIGRRNGLVSMQFGKPIAWFSFPPTQAREMAQALLTHAEACELDEEAPHDHD